jgi:hypothetical protein
MPVPADVHPGNPCPQGKNTVGSGTDAQRNHCEEDECDLRRRIRDRRAWPIKIEFARRLPW